MLDLKTGWSASAAKWGTLPTTIGIVTIKFLYKVPNLSSTFSSYLMWINRLDFRSWLGVVTGTSISCSNVWSLFLATPSTSFLNKRSLSLLIAKLGNLLWYSTILYSANFSFSTRTLLWFETVAYKKKYSFIIEFFQLYYGNCSSIRINSQFIYIYQLPEPESCPEMCIRVLERAHAN